MSQTDRQLSCNRIWLGGEKIKTDDGARSASMAQKTEKSGFPFAKNSTGNGAGWLKQSDNADQNMFESGPMNALSSDMEKPCCQTAAAPQEGLLNVDCRVGDTRSFAACATISETARELCRAVSVSLGLTMESPDTSEMDIAHPSCTANDHSRGEYLLGVGAVPLSCPRTQTAAAAAVSERDELPPHGHKQLVDMFKSSETGSRLQHLTSTRTCLDNQNFTLSNAGIITSEETDHLDTARAVSCSYAQSAPDNLVQLSTDRPCRVYNPPDEARDFGEAMESKFGGYQPEQFNIRIKSEDSEHAGAFWGSNYTFNEKYSCQGWGPRECMSTEGTSTSAPFICNPYERSAARPEQWYPGGMLRPPYAGYMKSEVGEWLNVDYSDTR